MSDEVFEDLIELSWEVPKSSQDSSQKSYANRVIIANTIARAVLINIRKLHDKQDESEASSCRKKKLYLMGMPGSKKIITSVLINPIGAVGRSKFLTEAIDDSELGRFSLQYSERWAKNSSQLLSAIKWSLPCVPLSCNDYQMRVTLGSFVFDKYRRPTGPNAGWSVDDFDEMLGHEISKGHLILGLGLSESLLLERVSDASDLFELEGEQLRASNIQHAVKIEFVSQGNKSIHLEVDFNLSGGHYEHFKSRWVESSSTRPLVQNRPLLQAAMINPDKADWELKIREKAILDPDQIDVSMRKLQPQIRLRDNVVEETLSTQPRQRTIMPIGFAIHRLMEKATMQFPIKGTDYVLEVSRYDIYERRVTMPVRKEALSTSPMDFKHRSSYWEAVVLSPSWDQDMIDIGKLTADQKMDVDALFDQLFKRRPNESQKAAFERLVRAITDVAGLWDQADPHRTEIMSTTSSDLHTDIKFVGGAIEGTLIELD